MKLLILDDVISNPEKFSGTPRVIVANMLGHDIMVSAFEFGWFGGFMAYQPLSVI